MKLQSRIAVLGGADPANPLDSDNKVRHTAVGMLLLAVGAWAFTAATAAFHSNLHASWPLALLGGALIAVVVFSIDLLVTATPLKDTNLGSRLRLVLIRGMVSLAMGLVISHATILFMYRDTLAQMVSAKNTAIAAETTERITHTSKYTPAIDQATQRVDDDRKQITAENQTLSEAQQKLAQLQKAWSDDTVCVNGNRAANGDRCGPGPSSNALKAELDAYRTVTLPAVVKNHDEQVAALTKDIELQSATITAATEQRNQEIKDGVAATLANVGLAAQTDALVELLRHDLFAWLWPAFFIVIDLAVALMKGVLPESDFDRARRTRRALASKVDDAIAASQTFKDLVDHAAAQQALVMKARIDHDVDRQLAALQQGAGRANTPPAAGRRRAVFAGLTVLVVALSLSMAASSGRGGSATAASGMQARGGQSITLRDGLTLHVPERAISGDAPVTARYRESRPWAGHIPRSATVELTTSGALTGRPQLRLTVPPGQEQAAQAGDLQLAFQSDDPSGWTQYPVSYDPATNTVVGELTHFSTWQFWEWDWAGIGASVSQTIGQWTGRRSDDVPQCDPKKKTPAWFNFDAGITNEPAMVVRSCLQGHDGDDVLDVQIVNNRPYGLMLHYNGAAVKYGWHEEADSLPGAFRDVVGDLTAGSKGLYLPPLSRAAVGIMKIGSGKQHKFPITPTAGTVTADLTSMLAQQLLDVAIGAAGRKWVQDVKGAAAAGSCSKMVINTNIPDRDTVYRILTGDGPQCIKDILVIAARNEIRQGAGMDLKTIGKLSDGISKMTGVITKAPGYLNKMGDLLDFGVDQWAASVPELGFGFSILARSVDTGGQNGNGGGKNDGGQSGSQNPGTGTLMFAVTGSCTTVGGTLSSTSSGFTPGGRYAIEVRRPDGNAYTGFTATGTVRPGGNIMWTWPCAGDPVGTYTTRITDNSTGRVTPWTPFTIGAAPGTQPPVPPTPAATAVKAYDNYGPVTTAGIPMCAGNPGRPESMPGGSVSQTFAVPNGVAYLDAALVQIDFNADMTVHATLSVNGTAKASNDQTPNNDTTFRFPRVPVRAGDTVTLTLTWTGRKGKLDTIYMTGNPPTSHLVITNTCSDGAPSLNRTDTGLRAVISGWSA
ncbi:DUF4407 domain-containing protein [Dactylosporangium sp. NPDC050688]|uniref:DUF4407 domain-containing protein n=1 Tax=Dactylosporangium sp. NPDC050688 TaxID=3157217 RepID=UPI0033DDB83A